jgi:pilus assembly protein CpaB
MIQNEPLLPMKLAGKDSGAGLPVVIPEGKRAVSVRVNDVIGVAGYVLPGTHVDVLATATPTNSDVDTTTKVVLTNVQVLAAGTKMEQDSEQGKPMAVNVVTLLVSPDEAERLTLGATQGKIQLALRNPLDQGAPETPGMKQAVLLGAAKPAGPARAVVSRKASPGVPVTQEAIAAPLPTVEIIRGDKRTAEVIK